MKKNNKTIIILIVIYICMVVALAIDFIVLKNRNYFALVMLLVCTIVGLGVYVFNFKYHTSITNDIAKTLDNSMSEALSEGEIGILVYNEEYEITWLSSLFIQRDINKIGEKILVWLPELQDLLSGRDEKTTIVINDEKYSVTKKDDAYVLFFKDISKEYDLKAELKDIAPVLGLVNFDNFDELSLNEDEIAYVNTNIKVPVLEYLRRFGIVYKTLRNHRLQLILNNQIYQKLLEDRFSILKKVRKASKSGDVDITLSLSFAYGGNNLSELDDVASNLLEIAENRGGDQVIVREIGKDVVFYGGSSEAIEGHSKVKVRVVSNTLRRLIEDCKNVIIVGHKDADADCFGSAIAVSLIVQNLGKEAYIVKGSGKTDPMIEDVIKKYADVINSKHNFVTNNEALSLLKKDSLVIMVDHHSIINSDAEEVLLKAKNIVIIDHHRRKADLDVDASFLYVEAGASSTTELVVEMFSYFSKNIDVSKAEANIMYIGLLIDTNHFRSRTDSRTFDVAKIIKQYGADSLECEELIEEPYEMSKKRYQIIAEAKRYKDNIVIANCLDIYPRSIASQAADMIVDIKEIDAAFVICKLSNNEVAISARSNGEINVQVILEKLGGGGHMTAAGMQTKEESQEELYDRLLKAIDEYLESVKENESNTIE